MIDPRNIRRASQTRAHLRYWATLLIQITICVGLLFFASWAFVTVNALLHPTPNYQIQLPTR
ncbi:hypothetical protein GCM10022239_03820 [Leifsonia bigeumensis]|uniref:Uncharacterized protein n=1 Tax=Leifsonella bigeumensis TaxID=433643 RepID=A0ABP7F674_9MICO